MTRPPKRRSRLSNLERTRLVWHAVCAAAGDLGPLRKLRWKSSKGPEMVETIDRRNLPKTTKGGESCFEVAARELSMSEATVRRIYYAELKRKTEAGGWVPEKRP
jgi:hypothetical protein